MAVCERCGSIQIVRLQSSLTDKWLAILDSREPYKCKRCGWKGRRVRNANEPDTPAELELSEGTTDPQLAVLDELDRPRRSSTTRQASKSSSRSASRSTGRRKSRSKKAATPERPREFDLSPLELSAAIPEGDDGDADDGATGKGWDERRRHSGSSRIKRSQRRQIMGAIAISALSLLVFALLGLSRSCGDAAL